MKRIILNLSKLPNNYKSATSRTVQELLFVMGFVWPYSSHASDVTKFQHEYADALVLQSGHKSKDTGRKWNQIFMSTCFDAATEKNEENDGTMVFDARQPQETLNFLNAARELVDEKMAQKEIFESEGVKVTVGIEGATLDFSLLLGRVMNQARAKWEAEFERA